MQVTRRVFIGWKALLLIIAVSILALTTCNQLSPQDILRMNDNTPPVVTIDSPTNGTFYAPSVTVTGTIIDACDADGTPGQVSSASYVIEGPLTTHASGEFTPDADGQYGFSFDTEYLSGALTVTVSAEDWNGLDGNDLISLEAPREIISFAFLVADNADCGLTTDAVGVIEGTHIIVPMSGVTDETVLVATYVITGTSVTVGGTNQTSGESPNDFSSPKDYSVWPNDGQPLTYSVTVVNTPFAPSGLVATKVSAIDVDPAIDLTWTDTATIEDGFTIERKKGAEGTYAVIADVAADVTSYPDSGLFGAQEYFYRIAAYNGDGDSAWSNEGSATADRFRLETVGGGNGMIQAVSMALDADDHPHISYFDENTYDLMYTRWNGSAWVLETVDTSGMIGNIATSIAVGADGYPRISTFEDSEGDPVYIQRNITGWLPPETVESTTDMMAESTSLALDADENAHISYYDETNGDLKYARWSGSAWVGQVSPSDPDAVDGADDVGYGCSLALDTSGNPHMSYYDWTNGAVKYARWSDSEWVLDVVGTTGWYLTSIALDADDNPHVSYGGSGIDALHYARWTGTEWDVDTFGGEEASIEHTSLALDADGYPHIAYSDGSDVIDVKYAWWDGASWHIELVDSGQSLYPAIALDSAGKVHIGYTDYESSPRLMYARDMSE